MVSNKKFLVEKHEEYNPLSIEYYQYWKGVKRKVIEGEWQDGKWMPPILYFYSNLWSIMLKSTNKRVKTQELGRPDLRDIDWKKSYIYVEAKGFSGFELDYIHTCNRLYDPKMRSLNEELGLIPKDSLIYVPAREYLTRIHPRNMGKALYENPAKNVMEIGARGYGKSYFTACMVAHNFLTDGAVDYDEYLQRKIEERPLTSSTVIGAIDSKFSEDLAKKILLGMDNLPGSIEYLGNYYPAPLSKTYKGTLTSAPSVVEAVMENKIGGTWKEEGSRSKIYHRTFKNNPFAANGTRDNLVVLDEVGFFDVLIPTLGQLKECTAVGGDKFGVIWMCGTGGDMEGGSTLAAQEVFYNPDTYDCLIFNDEWENRGDIGFFVPAHYAMNKYRDEEGILNYDAAEYELQQDREKAKKASVKKYQDELQNRPIKPSEAFLLPEGNFFPVVELKDHLAEIETNKHKYLDTNWPGSLKQIADGSIEYSIELPDNAEVIRDFPRKSNKNSIGCIEIYEHPVDNAPRGRYIAGTDPYDDDESQTDSLGSTFVLDTFTDRLVAEYTGRPATAKEYYENTRKLLKYYNAENNYENQKKGMFSHFEQHNSLFLLADTPTCIKDVENITVYSSGNKSKGTNASAMVNKWARELVKTWLLSPAYNQPDGVKNLHTIKSPALLKELISWHKDGNFDRVSAMGMLMILREDRYKQINALKEDPGQKEEIPPFFSRFYKSKLNDHPDDWTPLFQTNRLI